MEGGYILGGYSNSNISGDKTEDSLGWGEYWVVKLDSSGNIEWENTIGGDESEYLHSIELTFDGGYLLGGGSRSTISGDKTENVIDDSTDLVTGGSDYWIVKLDGIGNIQWQKTIGGNYDDVLHSLQRVADGGYILGGYSYSNISGHKTENNWDTVPNFSNADYWVVKLSGCAFSSVLGPFLGKDTALCNSSQILLDAGSGFTSQ